MHAQFKADDIETIAKKYGIKFMVYFGSYETEFYNSESDIDIAFLSKHLLSSEKRLQLLEDLIKFHRKSEIDLVDLIEAEPVLKYEIAVSGRVFYEQEPGLFDRYSSFYIKNFYELKPVIKEEMRQLGTAIEEMIKGNG